MHQDFTFEGNWLQTERPSDVYIVDIGLGNTVSFFILWDKKLNNLIRNKAEYI